MPPLPPPLDEVNATCSFCGHDGRYDVRRTDHDLSAVGQLKSDFPPAVRRKLTCSGCGKDFFRVFLGPRRLIGYHGCNADFARMITAPGADPNDWQYSDRAWDWLGDGVYFWEEAPRRAWEWAEQVCKRKGTVPAVVGALIAPRVIVDFGDTEFAHELVIAHATVEVSYKLRGKPLPTNRPFTNSPNDPDDKFRALDRLVVHELVSGLARKAVTVEAVRAPFEEGDIAYPGAKLYDRSHVQIAVRDLGCIVYVWRAARP